MTMTVSEMGVGDHGQTDGWSLANGLDPHAGLWAGGRYAVRRTLQGYEVWIGEPPGFQLVVLQQRIRELPVGGKGYIAAGCVRRDRWGGLWVRGDAFVFDTGEVRFEILDVGRVRVWMPPPESWPDRMLAEEAE